MVSQLGRMNAKTGVACGPARTKLRGESAWAKADFRGLKGWALLLAEVLLVLGFDDAGVAGQGEFGVVVLEGGFDEVGLGSDEGGLGADDGEVIADAGGKALGGVREGFASERDVALRDLDLLAGGLDIEHGGADLAFDVGAGGCDLLLERAGLGDGDFLLSAESGFFEDGDGELAGGGEVPVGDRADDIDDTVVAADAERGEALVFDGALGLLRDFKLGFVGAKIFSTLVSELERGIEGHGVELRERNGVDEVEGLAGGLVHLAVEVDFVLGDGILCLDEGLLLLLEFNLRTKDVQVDAGTGVARGPGVIEDELILLDEAVGVGDFGFVGEGAEIEASDGDDDAAPGVQGLPVRGFDGLFGGAIQEEGGNVEDSLLKADLRVALLHLDDGRDGADGVSVEFESGEGSGFEAEGGEVDLLRLTVGFCGEIGREGIADAEEFAVDEFGLLLAEDDFGIFAEASGDGLIEGEADCAGLLALYDDSAGEDEGADDGTGRRREGGGELDGGRVCRSLAGCGDAEQGKRGHAKRGKADFYCFAENHHAY
jgi:hypothetical protein